MGVFMGADVAARAGVPCIWAIHESFDLPVYWMAALPPHGPSAYVRRRGQAALATACAVVFEAQATRRQYAHCGDARRFVHVPYGVDVPAIDGFRAGYDRAAARQRLDIPVDATVLLCVGTFQPRKAQALLVQAFARVAADFERAFLVLVGMGDDAYSNGVRLCVEQSEVAERCRLVRVVSDIYEWYALADFLVCASDVESLPRTVLESMAFGVPVLATRVFGLAELIRDGDNGWLCDACDLKSQVDGLRRVLSMSDVERRRVAAAAQLCVRQQHDSRGYAEAYWKLMRGFIADADALPGDLLAR
jgi:glycosyltransferase involved in cell wall biosynthesis